MSKEKSLTIKDLQKSLRNLNPFGNTIDQSTVAVIDEWIPTGNYHVNALLSGDLFKGIPNRKSVAFSGLTGTGKTYLTLNVCREAQKMGYYVIYYDSEGAIDVDMVKNFDINPELFDHQPVSDITEFRTNITTIVKDLVEAKRKGSDIPKIFIALDSLGMLASSKEVADARSGNTAADMSRAKSIRSIFRNITSDLANLGIPLVMTNHIITNIGFIPGHSQSGGEGLQYAASIIVNLSKAQLKDKENRVGILVTASTEKNRFAKPNKIKFQIRWDKGMNPYIGMEQYIDWETCGIERGKIYTEKEREKAKLSVDSLKIFKGPNGETLYFEPKSSATGFAVKHLGIEVKPVDFFTEQVFTQSVLESINEKKVKPLFTFGESENSVELPDDFTENED